MAREKDEMRSDYALYTVAIIFFIITGIVFAVQIDQTYKSLGIIATSVLGIFFIGLGYTQRPKAKVQTVAAPPLPPPPPTQPVQPVQPSPAPTPTVAVEEKVVEVAPTGTPLTKVKGIGEKRSEQLKALGINTVEELAKASAKELALKLKISPKITQRWIENAKRLTEKS
ncbi:MAG: helix-hairpin-helix domain-containing protein [Candidatus Bathyarchaeia archaeon]